MSFNRRTLLGAFASFAFMPTLAVRRCEVELEPTEQVVSCWLIDESAPPYPWQDLGDYGVSMGSGDLFMRFSDGWAYLPWEIENE